MSNELPETVALLTEEAIPIRYRIKLHKEHANQRYSLFMVEKSLQSITVIMEQIPETSPMYAQSQQLASLFAGYQEAYAAFELAILGEEMTSPTEPEL
jgi:hypothetical protein